MLLTDAPETTAIRKSRRSFVHDDRCTGRERPVSDITVPGDPTDIRRAPKHIGRLQIEDPKIGELSAEQVSRTRVLDTFGLAGRSGGVEQKERMLCIDPARRAIRRHACDEFVPPMIAPRLHWHRRTGSSQHDDIAHACATLSKRLVGRRFQLDDIAAAPPTIGGNHADCTRIFDAIFERDRRKAAEYDRVNRADAGTGLHRDHRLGHERHIDHHAIATTDATSQQGVGETANFCVQLSISQLANIARLALENDRRLVTLLLKMNIEAVPRDIQAAVGEPTEIRCLRSIEGDGKGLLPRQMGPRELRPVPLRISCGLLA